MPANYDTAVKTSRITATRDYFANGSLEIQASDDSVLVVFSLSLTGGTVMTDTWTLAFDASTVAASVTGNATKAVLKNSGGDAHLTGLTVGTSGSDVNLDSTGITSGQNVTISSATVQHAA